MSARSRIPARHRRIPQKPKPPVYHVPTEGELAAVTYATTIARGW